MEKKKLSGINNHKRKQEKQKKIQTFLKTSNYFSIKETNSKDFYLFV